MKEVINVPLTEKQLEFMIGRIHEDNSFRGKLTTYLREMKEGPFEGTEIKE